MTAPISDSKEVSRRLANGVIAGIAVLSTLMILPQLNKTMWRDEGASLYAAHLSWEALWRQSQVVDRVLLPYYAFLHLWLEVSGNIEWARAPSLVAFGVTVFTVGKFAFRLGGLWCGAIAALVCATSPLMIESALDARPYAIATLISTLSIVSLFRWYESGNIRWFWSFCVAAIFVIALQIFLVLAPLFVLFVAVAVRPRRFLERWRSLVVPLGLVCLSTAFLAIAAAGQNGQIAWIGPMTGRRFAESIVGPASAGPSLLGEPAYGEILIVVGLILFVLAARSFKRGRPRLSPGEFDALALSLAWAVLPTLLLVVVSFERPEYLDRYVTASVPGMALVIGFLGSRVIEAYGSSAKMARAALLGGAIAAFFLAVTTSIAASREYVENIQAAAQYLVLHEGSSGAVALPDHSLTSGFDYYFAATHEAVREWPERGDQRYIEGLDLLDGPGVFSHAPVNVWLVNDGSVRTTGFALQLKRNGYVAVGAQRFSGFGFLEVLHFRRPTA